MEVTSQDRTYKDYTSGPIPTSFFKVHSSSQKSHIIAYRRVSWIKQDVGMGLLVKLRATLGEVFKDFDALDNTERASFCVRL